VIKETPSPLRILSMVVFTLSVFGLLMSMLFLLVSAPDVALSQIGVGTAIVPLMVMLAIRKIRGHR
jgi:uncharacterized MnhB-related membrane protein